MTMNKMKTCRACRTAIDARATICPNCRSKQGSGAGLAVLVGLGLIVTVGYLSTPSRPADPTADWKAEDAAQVGDSVAIKYPASTIMCSDRNDASKVYATGKFAFWEEMRLSHDDVWNSVKEEHEARKLAMRTAYSCQWAPRDVRFTVIKKEIIGTEKDMFHDVNYCLQPEGKTKCWWITEDFGTRSPFEQVRQKTTVATRTSEEKGE
jgi:hypothetical protein